MKRNLKEALHKPDPNVLGTADTIQRLIRLHGEPWMLDDDAMIKSINHEWWAGLFAEQNPIIHDADDGFYQYDDVRGIYGRITPETVAIHLSRQLLHNARDHGFSGLLFHRHIKSLETQLKFLRGLTSRFHAFASDHPVLAMDNGIVEIQGKKIRFHPFNQRFLVRHKTVVPYLPRATCPRYKSEILGSMFDADDASLFVRAMGLCMAGINPCQRLHIIEGDASAGKSTILNMPISLLGPDRCLQLRTAHLETRFELHAFHGKSLLYGVDVPANFLNTEAAHVLKALVSDEYFDTEGKSQRVREQLRGPFNVLIVTNCKLTYRAQGDNPAWRRRLTIYHAQTPTNRKRVAQFGEIIMREEGPGIVNLFLQGLVQALDEIQRTGDLILTQTQQERTDALVMRSNSTEAFVDACLIPDPEGSVTSVELLEAYATFCASQDWPPLPEKLFFSQLGQQILTKFGKAQSHGVERGRKKMRGWYGLTLTLNSTTNGGKTGFKDASGHTRTDEPSSDFDDL